MDIILFTLVAVLLYFFSDWLLKKIEQQRGKVFANRQIVFFIIIASLSIISFEVLQTILKASS